MTAKGYSLHIGVNQVNQEHYKGLPDLPSCENDAQAMLEIAQLADYQKSIIFPYTDANGARHLPTAENVLAILEEYSKELEAGDIFLFTYSGHGGQILDPSGEEEDLLDETFCLYDRQLIDDELNQAFCKFKAGVRILVFLDSCHSGTATRGLDASNSDPYAIPKQIPIELNNTINTENTTVYDTIHHTIATRKSISTLKASVKMYSACQDHELALAGNPNSLFTQSLLDILRPESFPRTYDELTTAIEACGTLERQPNFFPTGPEDEVFDNSIPFTIDGGPIPYYKGVDPADSELVELLVDFEEEVPVATITADLGTDFEVNTPQTKSRGIEDAKATTTLSLQGKKDKATGEKAWDVAYKAFYQLQGQGKTAFIEPNTSQTLQVEPVRSKSASTTNSYMPTWPSPIISEENEKNEFVWHLDEEHSQLAAARDTLLALPPEDRRVRIAHIDTGYMPEHPSTPENVLKDLGKSFVKGEEDNPGVEQWENARIEQDGHGLATLAILAGNKVTKEESYGDYEGYLGAVPFAEIVPIRIADSVALLFDTHTFAEAIYYAIEQKCDVVTMSMAGKPSRKWAKAINAAYEAGVTIVTAAGNNWRKGFKKILPKVVLYPSRYDRVISATGICVNLEPYDFEANSHRVDTKTAGGENMQGNWGPSAAMRTAVAGYTPNLPWAVMDKSNSRFYSRSGGGTSSATPQVAATAALWIAKHRKVLEEKGYAGTWRQVEAVKQAIFETADKSYFAYQQYYGNGAIKAMDALNYAVPDIDDNRKAPGAKIFFAGVREFLGPFFQSISKSGVEDGQVAGAGVEKLTEMAVLEVTQLLYEDPSLLQYSKHLNFENDQPLFENEAQAEAFRQKLKQSDYISSFLKGLL